MALYRFLALGILLLLPAAVAGDSVPQIRGQKIVSRDVVLEVGEGARNYRFWFSEHDQWQFLKPLSLAPGQPCRFTRENCGNRFYGRVIAIPQVLIGLMGEHRVRHALQNGKPLPGVSQCVEMIDTFGHISTWDSRERVIARYRVEVQAGNRLQIVFLGDNASDNTGHSDWWGAVVAVAGVFLSGIAMWFGWRIARRRQQTQPATG